MVWSASPGLKIWERRGTSDGFQILKKRFTRLKNLKAEVAEIRILLEADLTSSGICSVFEVADLDLDAGGRPLLGREGL